MPETLIGGGPDLDHLVIGLDTVVFNEALHWFRDKKTKRLYSKVAIRQEDGAFKIYLTGECEKNLQRENYGH